MFINSSNDYLSVPSSDYNIFFDYISNNIFSIGFKSSSYANSKELSAGNIYLI